MIRAWSTDDAEASYAVYLDAVRNGADTHYTAEQAEAWAPSLVMEDWWVPRLKSDVAWVSEDETGLNGLIALTADGYLDLFFVAPRARGDGTAAALYDTLLSAAWGKGLRGLTSHASHYLRPFLERRGWRVIAPEDVARNGQVLRRFEMAVAQLPSQVS